QELSQQLTSSFPESSFWRSLRNLGVVAVLALLQRVDGGGGAIDTADGGNWGRGSEKVCGVETNDCGSGSGSGGGSGGGGGGDGGESGSGRGVDGVDVNSGNEMFLIGTTHLWW
ncbi:hypothetical protein Vretifemale_12462, partial [Volvox reticuliferus]